MPAGAYVLLRLVPRTYHAKNSSCPSNASSPCSRTCGHSHGRASRTTALGAWRAFRAAETEQTLRARAVVVPKVHDTEPYW